jgi:hypothetical protein
MDNPVSKKAIKEAEEAAHAQIAEWVREGRYTEDVLANVKSEIKAIEDELGKRTIPYGGGFVVGKTRLPQYFPGVPAKVLDAQWRVYKDFADRLEVELATESRREKLISYDRGSTLTELKAKCRERGLVVSGDKKTLIARLMRL